MSKDRLRTVEEIRDYWLQNRGADGSDWEQAICAVYDLGYADALRATREALASHAEKLLRAARDMTPAQDAGKARTKHHSGK